MTKKKVKKFYPWVETNFSIQSKKKFPDVSKQLLFSSYEYRSLEIR